MPHKPKQYSDRPAQRRLTRDLNMAIRRKLLLGSILLAIVALHLGLFAAGGAWRTLRKVLVVVDIFSGWFVFAAVRESRKLEKP